MQAVANALGIRLYIIESHDNFTERTIIEPTVTLQGGIWTIDLGHVNEVHYVSAVPDVLEIFRTTMANNVRAYIANSGTNESNNSSASNCRKAYLQRYMRKRRATESTECTQNRLTKQRKYAQEHRTSQKQCKAKRLTHCRNAQQQKTTNNNHKQEKPHENQSYKVSVDNLISKFHTIVLEGPLYICTCCDQLWYKHSVSLADKSRLSHPTVAKYLLSKTSVDNKEWLCDTCKRHLKKNKVPLCAAINGMQFPAKPQFLDLNELEWRLLAPRLAFVTLFGKSRLNENSVEAFFRCNAFSTH